MAEKKNPFAKEINLNPAAKALPTKKTINLAQYKTEGQGKSARIGLIVVVVLLVVLFGKFAVADPIISAVTPSQELITAQEQLATLQVANADYDKVEKKYSRYIVPGLTAEELALCDRTELVRVFKKISSSGIEITAVQVEGNVMQVALEKNVAMAQISTLVSKLNADKAVLSVAVSTAKSDVPTGATAKETSATLTVTMEDAATAVDTTADANAEGEEVSNG